MKFINVKFAALLSMIYILFVQDFSSFSSIAVSSSDQEKASIEIVNDSSSLISEKLTEPMDRVSASKYRLETETASPKRVETVDAFVLVIRINDFLSQEIGIENYGGTETIYSDGDVIGIEIWTLPNKNLEDKLSTYLNDYTLNEFNIIFHEADYTLKTLNDVECHLKSSRFFNNNDGKEQIILSMAVARNRLNIIVLPDILELKEYISSIPYGDCVNISVLNPDSPAPHNS